MASDLPIMYADHRSFSKLRKSGKVASGADVQLESAALGVFEEPTSLNTLADLLANFNPNHDERGRFSSGEGGDGTPADDRVVKGTTVTPPPPGPAYQPNLHQDHNKDGVTDAARVGVPAFSVPPPPAIGRLPNLTPHERAVEHAFIEHYEADPDGVAGGFRDTILKSTKPGDPPTFGTDDAKTISEAWSHPDAETRLANRSTLNLAVHQTANAICKRAFLQHLDTLDKGDQILVTVGGCGAGKSYGLDHVPQALAMKAESKAVWDSAGDQNATENPWVQSEAEKRGLKVNYVYVHADPETQWANPKMGVVARATKPDNGRMIDARVYADSYELGAKNHAAFAERNKDNPNARFVYVRNGANPEQLPGMPPEALKVDGKKLAAFASKTLKESDAPQRVKDGGLLGERVWK